MNAKPAPKVRLRLYLQPQFALGPGKADVLRGIRETGSISAAGRLTGMSYKRTWELVSTMNQSFREPLVQTNTGGQNGGGASLTPMGTRVLNLYERIMADTNQAIARDLKQLVKLTAADN